MISNVCKIENGTRDLDAILKECQKVAVYNELSHKQGLQLRLLCEELDGMLPNIIQEFDGDLWIEFTDGVCKVKLSIEFEKFTSEKKEKLVAIAKDKKNAAAVGIVGKIRSAIEHYFLDEEVQQAYAMSTSAMHLEAVYFESVDYSYFWSLEGYKNTVQKEEQNEDWDELEKSVLASVADDVIVGVKGTRADITVIKKFA